MSPVKIAAIAFILGVFLIVGFFATPSFFEKQTLKEEPVETPIKKQAEDSFKNPLTWLKEKTAEQIIFIEQEFPIKNPAPQALSTSQKPLKSGTISQKLFEEVGNFLLGGIGVKQPSRDEIENYYTELLKTQQAVGGFTAGEFAVIKKDENGRPLFPEELFSLAENGDNSEGLKISFGAWQRLSEKYSVNLKKMAVEDALLSTHQTLIDWVEYFIETHQKLASGNLSKAEIDNLLSQYRQRARTELPKIQKVLSLNQPTASVSLNRILNSIPVFIPKKVFAQAETVTCDFGGAVDYLYTNCCNGVGLFLQSVPGRNFCGGALMLDFLEIIRYYEYGYFGPGACILGKARRGPGVCSIPEEDCATSSFGSGAIMYFGSASATDFCAIK